MPCGGRSLYVYKGVIDAELVERVRAAFGSDVIFVAPHALEASDRNKIPNTMAYFLADAVGASSDECVVQGSSAFHTGARPLGRPVFDGEVAAGGRHVLVNDVTVMGGTLAEVSDFIQTGRRGGQRRHPCQCKQVRDKSCSQAACAADRGALR